MLQPNEESLLALIGGSIGVELSLCMLGRLDSLHVICIHPQTDHATGTVTQDIEMELWQISTIPINVGVNTLECCCLHALGSS
jgi:hypothetical protein